MNNLRSYGLIFSLFYGSTYYDYEEITAARGVLESAL
jgi:hypothetical protein